MAPAFTPVASASAPSLAPTFFIWMTFRLKGREPARMRDASSSADSPVKLPVMDASPVVMADCTIGALITSPSITI